MSEPTYRKVWVAWTNTDLTEGRGWRVPLAVCDIEATAIRLGARASVQGSNCEVTEETAVRLAPNHAWLIPGWIDSATDDDRAAQRIMDEQRSAIQRARDAGLTDADIASIRGGGNG